MNAITLDELLTRLKGLAAIARITRDYATDHSDDKTALDEITSALLLIADELTALDLAGDIINGMDDLSNMATALPIRR